MQREVGKVLGELSRLLYNIFEKEDGSDKDTRKAMLRTSSTNIEITNEADFLSIMAFRYQSFYNVNKDGSKPASCGSLNRLSIISV